MSKNRFAFPAITALFFLWGFTTVNNDVLIPWYESHFELSDTQSMFVNLAFFGSYGFWSLFYFIYSVVKFDPINRLGYKTGVLFGLIISAVACMLFYPMTLTENYYLCLIPLFLLGMGLTLLQISCNPFVSVLGDPEGASTRLNLSQGFNSLGTAIGPMLLGYFIFGFFEGNEAVQIPYLVIGAVFAIWALLIWITPLPDFRQPAADMQKSALHFRHLRFGMLAIFFYVGAEVAIGSKLIEYLGLPEVAGMDEVTAACYVGLYWGGAMIGRLTISVVSNRNLSLAKAVLFGLLTALGCFAFLVLVMTIFSGIKIRGLEFSIDELSRMIIQIGPLAGFVLCQFILMLIFRKSSRWVLVVFSFVAIILLITAFSYQGVSALWCMVALGLFNSIMWSNIFTLSIEGLNEYTSQGSALLVIMICGGAIIPLGVGLISDFYSLQTAYLLPIICYIYVAFFGLFGVRKRTS